MAIGPYEAGEGTKPVWRKALTGRRKAAIARTASQENARCEFMGSACLRHPQMWSSWNSRNPGKCLLVSNVSCICLRMHTARYGFGSTWQHPSAQPDQLQVCIDESHPVQTHQNNVLVKALWFYCRAGSVIILGLRNR